MSKFLDKAEKLMACRQRKELEDSIKSGAQHYLFDSIYDNPLLVDEDYSDDEYWMLK